MLDGENPTREELIKYLDEEIARLEAEEQLANSQEIDDTKHSKQGVLGNLKQRGVFKKHAIKSRGARFDKRQFQRVVLYGIVFLSGE